jgi:hypothetical protein
MSGQLSEPRRDGAALSMTVPIDLRLVAGGAF